MSREMVQRFAGLLTGAFLVLIAFGLVGSLVSMSLAERGLTDWVGSVGVAYFVGLAVGSLGGERTIERVGYLRAYGMLTSVASAGVLLLVLADSPAGWLAARGLQGMALGGLFVCIESWMGADASQETRGRVLAFYQVTLYLGLIVGQGLLVVLADVRQTAFVLGAMVLSLAAIPVAWTPHEPPALTDRPRLAWAELLHVAWLGVVGCFVSGVVTGAVYSVAPAMGVVVGLTDGQVAMLMSAFIGGGMVLQLPLGRASDLLDRRMVLGVIGALAAVGALLSGLALDWPALLIALAAFEGGWVFAIYTIALAYTFDRVAPSLALAANARLLAVFCVGSILGAGGSAAALSRVGAGGFFSVVGLASAGLALAAFHAWRIRDPLPMDERSDVVVVPRTSPVAAELDPRTEHSKEEDPRHEAEGPKVFSGC